jgi:hypothetical protein
MKPVAEMTEAEKDQARAWIRNWEKTGPILEEMRRKSIRGANTLQAIAAFDGAFQTAVRDFPPKPWSGLIEQQRLFQLARK